MSDDGQRPWHFMTTWIGLPAAKVEDLAAYDAIIVGVGTRFGRLPSSESE